MGLVNYGSAQVTLTTAGTRQRVMPEPTPDVPGAENPQVGGAVVRALTGNTGKIYVGGGAVSATNGYQLAAGERTPFLHVADVGSLWFDGDTNGDKICLLWVGP